MNHAELYEQPCIREVTGPTVRPGGLLLTERLTAYGQLPPGAAVLDLGCGCGETMHYLQSEWGLDAFGIDRSGSMLKEGLSRHSKLPVMCAEASTLPFASGVFDAVFCECVLSLVMDIERVLTECRRILKSEGLLLISDLYLRSQGLQAEPQDSSYNSCLRGVVSRQLIEQRIQAGGFSMLLWEDHSRLLKDLAARIVLQHGSLLSFWRKGLDEHSANCLCEIVKNTRPGYYLLAARKGPP